MTIYEEALKKIYDAYGRVEREATKESMLELIGTIIAQRGITGDPSKAGADGAARINSTRNQTAR